jgi:hypothetical protein
MRPEKFLLISRPSVLLDTVSLKLLPAQAIRDAGETPALRESSHFTSVTKDMAAKIGVANWRLRQVTRARRPRSKKAFTRALTDRPLQTPVPP